jgi:LysR family transcriptional regulator, nod-box dependent transcriptional activator
VNFKGLDLNLLVALDALLQECSVTVAARRIHLSQSATSTALGRLRQHFRDPLLVSIGRRMERTPYAIQLAGDVRSILQQIDASLRGPMVFAADRSTRRFTIAASDYAVSVLLLAVQRRCAEVAPGIVLEILPVTRETTGAVTRGELDLLITPDRYRIKSCPVETLFEDELVCVAAQERKPLGRSISLTEFKAADHVVFQPDPGHVIAFDVWLHRQYHFEPAVKLFLANYPLLPQAVVGTDRIATLPARLAAQFARTLPIRILRPSFSMPPLVELAQWHAARTEDAGLSWLRSIIRSTAMTLA